LKHVRPRIDAILVTHAHFDHLLDVPSIMRRTQAKLLSGETAVHLTESLGISPNQCEIVQAGSTRSIGPWTIRVLAAQHDRLFGKVPFDRCPKPTTGANGPVKTSDWCTGEPLAFVIEAAGKRIYIDSGGVPGAPSLSQIKHVHLAILGVALPDSQQRFAEVVRRM
jgi:L-ascorbate metabolism protein UlaG (beta-lactamase superfamily)